MYWGMSWNSEQSFEMLAIPNIVYVVDGHGEGWYCTGVDEEATEPQSGECVHEDSLPYSRDFGG